MTTLQRTIDIKLEECATDAPIWQWLCDVIEKLGEDGMSSDESDTDERTGLPIYRVTNMKWRRKMVYELNMVDKLRLVDRDLYSGRGAKPIPRLRDERNSDSRRASPKGIPKKLYSAEWLQDQTPREYRELMIPDEDFQWLQLLKK